MAMEGVQEKKNTGEPASNYWCRSPDIIKKSLAISYQDNKDLGHNTVNDGMELDINTYSHFKDVYQPPH